MFEYFDIDRTLIPVEKNTVSRADVLKQLSKPLFMDELRKRLGGVQSENTIWDMINDGDIIVRNDCKIVKS